MKIKNESNKKSDFKTALIFVTILVLLLILGLMSFWRFDNTNNDVERINNNYFKNALILSEMNAITIEYRLAEMEHVLSLTEIEMNFYENKLDSLNNKLITLQKNYNPRISSKKEFENYENFLLALKNYLASSKISVGQSRLNNNIIARDNLRCNSLNLYSIMRSTLNKLIQINYSHSANISANSKRSFLLLVEKLSTTSNQKNISLINEFVYNLRENIKNEKEEILEEINN